ncbi:MAG: hypothetical protein IV097_17200 [Burkholderiaceae bacterium]|nr:hypothetical protein [Burkholderiaceae bacterium]MBY0237182.1 hypothetical protein [Burkholderiaceae bacterium]
MTEPDLLSPNDVLAQVAAALPAGVRGNLIVCGSLAAAYWFFAGDGSRAIRTKDIDGLCSPHAKAVAAATAITDQLFEANWKLRNDSRFPDPGKPGDAVEGLPMVRLHPPEGSKWFLELMAAPPPYVRGAGGKKLQAIDTAHGSFALCSFDFLALAEWNPKMTKVGIRIARPEMMALANMLHHPAIADTLIEGTNWKRSNKDLGRVLALAHLTIEQDRRAGADDLEDWPVNMWTALQEKFGPDASQLALRAGAGIRELMQSKEDFSQAVSIANLGLLASMDLGIEEISATARRLEVEVIEELEILANAQSSNAE